MGSTVRRRPSSRDIAAQIKAHSCEGQIGMDDVVELCDQLTARTLPANAVETIALNVSTHLPYGFLRDDTLLR